MNGAPPSPFTPRPPAPMLPAWQHVLAMSDSIGMFEHAELASPRIENGYCTDDMARLLIAIVREPAPGRVLGELAGVCLRFLVDAQGVTGRARNRRSADGRWHDRRGVEDCWGRSVWAFGSTARFAPAESIRESFSSACSRTDSGKSGFKRARASRRSRSSTASRSLPRPNVPLGPKVSSLNA